jgi:ABC-type sugar transport system substrate-binding protein
MTLPPPVQQACERLALWNATFEASEDESLRMFQADAAAYPGMGDIEAMNAQNDDATVVAMHFLRAAGFLGDAKA